MSPLVERLGSKDVTKTGGFSIDLSRVRLDLARLDFYTQALRDPNDPDGHVPHQFIVRGNKMYIFQARLHSDTDHRELNERLTAMGIKGTLECAGFLTSNVQEGRMRRMIHGFSTSVMANLSKQRSDEYKHTQLSQKLRPHFEIF